MKRRVFLVSVPPFVLGAAGAFAAGRLSTSGLADVPSCGSDGDGAPQALPPAPPGPADQPATLLPGATPRLVAPLPTPTDSEQAWLQEWLDLVVRPAGKAESGC
jgi:hypothetical protein